VESEGFPAVLKDPAVYVQSSLNNEDFAAGKELDTPQKASRHSFLATERCTPTSMLD